MKKAIGIYGGTFDPIHTAHLETATEVLHHCDLNAIHFIPCKKPVHKDHYVATATQRFHMVDLACQSQPKFIADDREIQRDSASYMIDTLKTLKHDYPDTPLCLIIGTDAFIKLDTWHQWQDLANYTHFIILQRPDYPLTSSPQMHAFYQQHKTTDVQDLHQKPSGLCYLASATPLSISATMIREKLLQHQTVDGLLPQQVLDYLLEQEIYGSKNSI